MTADAPGVPETTRKVHVQRWHRSKRSSEGKGLCFRTVSVQNVHLLLGLFFFLKERKGSGKPTLLETQLK